MKQITLIFLYLFLSFGMFAQENQETKEKKNYRHAIGISAGTGYSINYAFKVNEYFSLNARYNNFKYKHDRIKQELDGENVLIDIETDYQGFDIALSINPFKSGFRLIAGYGSFQSTDLTISTVFAESLFIGDVEFTSDDIGIVTIVSTWQQQLPYAGIGFGRVVPKNKRLSFGVEFGTYFANSPEVSLQATGILENTVDQEALLQESFNELTYLPYLQLRLSYAIF